MKKLILLLFALIRIAPAQAQETAYLEVSVSETFEVQPSSFEYHISVTLEPEEEEYDLDRDYSAQRKAFQSRIKENEAQLKQFLESNNIKYIQHREEGFAINPQGALPVTYRIKVNNKAELDKLVTLLRQLSYIHGQVKNKDYPDFDGKEIEIFEKLYNKAKLKAEKMATLMNCSLGKVLSVENVDPGNRGYFEIINQDMYEQIPLDESRTDPLNLLVTQVVCFRFELVRK